MNPKSVFIYVNGILTFPGRSTNWTGRAVTRTIIETGLPAEKVEYLSLATLHRLIGQRNRVKKLARTLSFYEDRKVVLVGHSNGCAVILGALRYLEWPHVEHVHFFSGACQADFQKNGLRQAQNSGRVKMVHCYAGGKDAALWLASSCVGKWLGYGTLGRTGPINHAVPATRVVKRDDWGHSDWWNDYNFGWTMKEILTNSET